MAPLPNAMVMRLFSWRWIGRRSPTSEHWGHSREHKGLTPNLDPSQKFACHQIQAINTVVQKYLMKDSS
jgi:hypothetical protein